MPRVLPGKQEKNGDFLVVTANYAKILIVLQKILTVKRGKKELYF